MKKIYKTILISIFLISELNAENNNNEDKNSNKPKLEIGIKSLNVKFIPFEYKRDLSESTGIYFENYSQFKGNRDSIIPFFVKYKNPENNFSLEFQYINVNIPRANYIHSYQSLYGDSISKRYLDNTERTDYKLNILYHILNEKPELLSLGLGIRKIDRLTNSNNGLSISEESIKSHGLQIAAKSQIPLIDNLNLNIGFEYYITQGKRYYSNKIAANSILANGIRPIFQTNLSNSNTLGIFQGYEFDVSLSYQFFNSLKFYLGYYYNFSKFKYQNYNDQTLRYEDFRNTYYYFQNNRGIGGSDIISGVYLGLSYNY
ncbi:outer membrane protein [Leptospira ryugenii]|uniref:Outer membrane protein n=1 Tax=Leptospira ryugenii TaxID=1917863 RepID=A0A2P2E5F9_9LEPT|nr:LA_2444/LA_4059 family outer membrane protein [Leptospira ryugenii]GBF52118.1 outer membrane protein [Leptospira ryugenii]